MLKNTHSTDDTMAQPRLCLDSSQIATAATPEPIAIVGMACRLPGGITNPSDFWDFLSRGQCAAKQFPNDRLNLDGFYHPNSQRPGSFHTKGACLLDENPRLFDQDFFGLNSSQVKTMDPAQRKILEVAYEAFENAGEPWERFSGSRTGVFLGSMNTDHSIIQTYNVDFSLPHTQTGGSSSILSNRVNHIFNLRGPSVTVDTACSSAMYALHIAVNSIRNRECDAAIVGGSNLILSPEMHILTARLGALSSSSTCQTFDASADGYGRGEGFGALYLKRHSDAIAGRYPIRALVRATAVNSNGRTAGISHPSTESQESLIRQAYRSAGLSTDTTGYFECHGTGTPVGDPIEVSAIGKAFGPNRKNRLLIGSVKPNLGHAEAASGVVGIIKTVLCLEKAQIPATVGIRDFNSNIDFDRLNVRVVTSMTPWPQGSLRRASVNSFGYGGANAHCILDHESAFQSQLLDCLPLGSLLNPKPNGEMHRNKRIGSNSSLTTRYEKVNQHSDTHRLVLLPFSAHNEDSLSANVDAVGEVIERYSLADVAYTLSARRSKFYHRSFCILDACTREFGNSNTMRSRMGIKTQPSQIAFIFTGQGAQWKHMGSQLFEYPIFRESIRAQSRVLEKLSNAPSWKVEDVMTGFVDIDIHRVEVSQTICTALQVALTDLLGSWGIVPSVCAGHSSGEIGAAYAAGSISAAEAILIAYCRGESISRARNLGEGMMLAVGMSKVSALSLLSDMESKVQIAAINSPTSVTLSGDVDTTSELKRRLDEQGIFTRELPTNGVAYHSHHMNEPGFQYEEMLQQALLELQSLGVSSHSSRRCQIQWISSVTTEAMKVEHVLPEYWRKNLESPVEFYSAIETILTRKETKVDVMIEIGPHSSLRSPIEQIIAKTEIEDSRKPEYIPALKRHEDAMRNVLELCGLLFCLNTPVDLTSVNVSGNNKGNSAHGSVCVDLPTYKYSYGPPIYYESRIAREFRHREYLRHDLLGVRQPGTSRKRPSWRNFLRVKDIPWIKDHKLIPDIVLPGSAYVCMAVEAASQFLAMKQKDMVASFKLRDVSIKSAMRIPEDDFGLETVLDLSLSSKFENWLEFHISSVTDEGVWTEHASGLIRVYKEAAILSETIDHRIDARTIEAGDWYQTFDAVGLGYGKSFRGLSELRSDPNKNIATADIALRTTDGMFKGPESSYPIHPASLDLCNQLALIACHGGQTGRVKHAFIPVFIDEMMIWSSKTEADWSRGIAHAWKKGLRGVDARIQLFDQSGCPKVNIVNIRSVSWLEGLDYGLSYHDPPSPYTRLVWKPDISTLSRSQAAKVLAPKLNAMFSRPEDDQNTLSSSELQKPATFVCLESLLDLTCHRNPSMTILEIDGTGGDATHVAMQVLGPTKDRKQYDKYTFASASIDILQLAEKKFSSHRHMEFRIFDVSRCPEEQGFDSKFDLIITTNCLESTGDIRKILLNTRPLLKPEGRMILMEPVTGLLAHGLIHRESLNYRNKDDRLIPFHGTTILEEYLRDQGFSGIDLELNEYAPSLGALATIVTTAVELPVGRSQDLEETVYIIYYRQRGAFHDALASELITTGVLPIVVALHNCNIPENARLILATDLETHLLLGENVEDFQKIKELVFQASSILWLTNGGLLRGYEPRVAVVTGLVRMLTTEDSLSRYGIFHLEPNFNSNKHLLHLLVEREKRLSEGDFEREIAMDNGIAHISRLILDEDLNNHYRKAHRMVETITSLPLYSCGPMVADFATPGLLSSLYFQEAFHGPIAEDWIEVKTAAISLNWKDIAVSVGKIQMEHYSSECAGIVTKIGKSVQHLRPGDRVYALAWDKFGNYIRLPACQAQKMPQASSFTQFATVPLVFCTAIYALKHLAHLQKDEKILIQSATGGLGLAAIQIARHIGAEIYATAGTEEKIQYLRDRYRMARDHVFDSRHLADIPKMMKRVNRGFDVILSSSNGEMMYETWRCIAPRGRLIDVGRIDVQNSKSLALDMFTRNTTFSSFDLGIIAAQDPKFCGKLMEEVQHMIEQGTITPITPLTTFDVSQLEQALLFFSRGKHMGKIVIDYTKENSIVKMRPPLSKASFHPDAVYVIIGGMGGLGRSIVPWMVQRGARKLLILSRSGAPSKDAAMMIEDLEMRQVFIRFLSCDITSKEQVRKALKIASDYGSIKGVLHAAVVFEDRLYEKLTHAQWKHGLSAKVNGTINLHKVTLELSLSLDFFIMTSSFEAVVALPTQSAYCAANSFQDAFARYRRAQGLPACAIAFGLVTEIGEVGQKSKTRDLIYKNHLYRTGELGFLRLLEAAFFNPPECTQTWHNFDPLGEAQITTCIEPSQLAKEAKKNHGNSIQLPRWHSDKKFSHILQSMNDYLDSEKNSKEQPQAMKAMEAVVITTLDDAIRKDLLDEAAQVVIGAIIERTSTLLAVERDKIHGAKSVAEYGVDSLVAVELRSWLGSTFQTTISLLKLLDESLSIRDLGHYIVDEYQRKCYEPRRRSTDRRSLGPRWEVPGT